MKIVRNSLIVFLFLIGVAQSVATPPVDDAARVSKDKALEIARRHFWGTNNLGTLALLNESESTWRIAANPKKNSMMPSLIAVVDKATGTCLTEVPWVDALEATLLPVDAPVPEDDADFLIIAGVRREGRYRIRDARAVSIFDALKIAGGPAMCDTCYRSAGEAGLWNLARPAHVVRGTERFKVNQNEWRNWWLKSGDTVYFDHVLL